MNLKFQHAEMHLGRCEFVGLRDAAGTLVQCLHGRLWITQNDDREDHYLGANETLTLVRKGLTLIHATETADFALFAPKPLVSARARLRRSLLASMRALGRWIARNFGPDAITNRRLRGWYGAL